MSFPDPQRPLLLKLLSLFSLVRGYNIGILVLAQYLTAHYILVPQGQWEDLILDFKFATLVSATALTTAAGYIINNFFDAPKDQINRPKKYILEHLISQQLQLILYFVLNIIAFILASSLSFKVVLFFFTYMLLIGLYSGIIKRLFWLSNIFSAFLMILPFWAITFYFKNFDTVIFYYATYLFFLILARDIVKDLENFRGDWVQRYQTLPVVFSHQATKVIITIATIATLIPALYLIQQPLGRIQYFFGSSFPFLILVLFFLWKAQSEKAYLWVHNLLKLWILIGVLCIALIYR